MAHKTTRFYSKRIIAEREAAGLSRRQLAAKAGISHQVLAALEGGAQSTFWVYLRVFYALGMRLEIEGGAD
jgi:transcriptional regulator with XRE-family HTH domain